MELLRLSPSMWFCAMIMTITISLSLVSSKYNERQNAFWCFVQLFFLSKSFFVFFVRRRKTIFRHVRSVYELFVCDCGRVTIAYTHLMFIVIWNRRSDDEKCTAKSALQSGRFRSIWSLKWISVVVIFHWIFEHLNFLCHHRKVEVSIQTLIIAIIMKRPSIYQWLHDNDDCRFINKAERQNDML